MVCRTADSSAFASLRVGMTTAFLSLPALEIPTLWKARSGGAEAADSSLVLSALTRVCGRFGMTRIMPAFAAFPIPIAPLDLVLDCRF
jgi:hypothetical protein